jgi:hypothetical protein
MAGTSTKVPTDPATLAWNELVDRVDALITAWQGEDLPPDLSQFLPAEPVSLRRLVLTELIKIDLEYRWQHHELPKLVEEYVEEFPELADLWPKLRSQMLGLATNREFNLLSYSRAVTPKAFARMDQSKEFHSLGKVLMGYEPNQIGSSASLVRL